ncbi:hypothetical protein [Amycolatopsis alba]|uniref:Uncharacterized protein n=1 Tax=Amycolatopsis alba DSM 44262 TaxID=1125972 RepID=A0A229REG2_AMYAL|nr:hypothetical protein [Amycolatopsis alba]OXM44804.1 hypothetical protein CFP75_33315 [Amycolatopsis alba DSM 44262]
MELPGPDPDRMRAGTQLEAALIVAAAPGGDATAAIDIADQMVKRGLSTTGRGQLLASSLMELSHQRLTATDAAPDPYATLAHRLVGTGVCTQSELETAFMARVLTAGVDQGWLDAALYDRLAAAGGNDPSFQALLAKIERR